MDDNNNVFVTGGASNDFVIYRVLRHDGGNSYNGPANSQDGAIAIAVDRSDNGPAFSSRENELATREPSLRECKAGRLRFSNRP